MKIQWIIVVLTTIAVLETSASHDDQPSHHDNHHPSNEHNNDHTKHHQTNDDKNDSDSEPRNAHHEQGGHHQNEQLTNEHKHHKDAGERLGHSPSTNSDQSWNNQNEHSENHQNDREQLNERGYNYPRHRSNRPDSWGGPQRGRQPWRQHYIPQINGNHNYPDAWNQYEQEYPEPIYHGYPSQSRAEASAYALSNHLPKLQHPHFSQILPHNLRNFGFDDTSLPNVQFVHVPREDDEPTVVRIPVGSHPSSVRILHPGHHKNHELPSPEHHGENRHNGNLQPHLIPHNKNHNSEKPINELDNFGPDNQAIGSSFSEAHAEAVASSGVVQEPHVKPHHGHGYGHHRPEQIPQAPIPPSFEHHIPNHPAPHHPEHNYKIPTHHHIPKHHTAHPAISEAQAKSRVSIEPLNQVKPEPQPHFEPHRVHEIPNGEILSHIPKHYIPKNEGESVPHPSREDAPIQVDDIPFPVNQVPKDLEPHYEKPILHKPHVTKHYEIPKHYPHFNPAQNEPSVDVEPHEFHPNTHTPTHHLPVEYSQNIKPHLSHEFPHFKHNDKDNQQPDNTKEKDDSNAPIPPIKSQWPKVLDFFGKLLLQRKLNGNDPNHKTNSSDEEEDDLPEDKIQQNNNEASKTIVDTKPTTEISSTPDISEEDEKCEENDHITPNHKRQWPQVADLLGKIVPLRSPKLKSSFPKLEEKGEEVIDDNKPAEKNTPEPDLSFSAAKAYAKAHITDQVLPSFNEEQHPNKINIDEITDEDDDRPQPTKLPVKKNLPDIETILQSITKPGDDDSQYKPKTEDNDSSDQEPDREWYIRLPGTNNDKLPSPILTSSKNPKKIPDPVLDLSIEPESQEITKPTEKDTPNFKNPQWSQQILKLIQSVPSKPAALPPSLTDDSDTSGEDEEDDENTGKPLNVNFYHPRNTQYQLPKSRNYDYYLDTYGPRTKPSIDIGKDLQTVERSLFDNFNNLLSVSPTSQASAKAKASVQQKPNKPIYNQPPKYNGPDSEDDSTEENYQKQKENKKPFGDNTPHQLQIGNVLDLLSSSTPKIPKNYRTADRSLSGGVESIKQRAKNAIASALIQNFLKPTNWLSLAQSSIKNFGNEFDGRSEQINSETLDPLDFLANIVISAKNILD